MTALAGKIPRTDASHQYFTQAAILDESLFARGCCWDGLNRYAYCRNNPVKYSDPTGHRTGDRAGDVTVNTRTGAVHTYDGPSNPPGGAGRQHDTQNKQESTPIVIASYDSQNNTMTVYTYSSDFSLMNATSFPAYNDIGPPNGSPVEIGGQYSVPESFPTGTWNITGAGESDNPRMGPITTDAHQEVTTYAPNPITGALEASGTKDAKGYNVHGSDHALNTRGQNNAQNYTWGCIRAANSDVRSVIPDISRTRDAAGNYHSYITVY